MAATFGPNRVQGRALLFFLDEALRQPEPRGVEPFHPSMFRGHPILEKFSGFRGYLVRRDKPPIEEGKLLGMVLVILPPEGPLGLGKFLLQPFKGLLVIGRDEND